MGPHEVTDPPLDGPASGEGFLALFKDERMVALLHAPREDWLDHKELNPRVGYRGKALRSRLHRLEAMGLLVCRQPAHDKRRRQWRLTDCGRELLELGGELTRLASALGLPGCEALLVKSLTNPLDRAILRTVLDTPKRFSSLLRLLRVAGHAGGQLEPSTLSGCLARLQRLGLLAHQPAPPGGRALYAQGEHAWRLARISLCLALWHWRWKPDQPPQLVGDLLGLVKLVAERVRLEEGTENGTVVLHVQAPPGIEGSADVVVALTDGRIFLVTDQYLGAPDARVQAPPLAWCEALRSGNFDGLQIEGDALRARSLLAAVAAVMRP